MTAPTLTSLLQGFFTERLARQLQASPQTIAAYRDTIKLLVMFAAQKTKKAPSGLAIDDLDAVTIGAFLDYLDHERHNSTATHNARLAAVHSFYRYALPLIPDRSHTASQVLAIPQRRHDRAIVSYLTSPETDALLAAPDRTTWYGRRDHALLLTTVQTGLRVSEVTGLTISDVTTTTPGAAVHTTGKGRKERTTPLTRQTAAVLRAWLPEVGPAPTSPVFPTQRGTRMSADAVQRLVAKHAIAAAHSCPSISAKHVTPHTLRHTAAMTLLHAGVDTSVIALWLGHQSPVTTHIYLHADMTIKERALSRVPEPNSTPGRYRPADDLMNFLERL
ncbi:tyrosine-type recombinase/integrase [Mycobacterium marinum]|uniref:tyrosine-type recombinase/integrase n=1 Tax=Mycobacterium marinum TaxID=1781 RepID=UPI001922578D|nr:tyrosine-type recombinase/integrase [Mycobacterium marinum]QQW35636.1 tyrosine-type recombinase/integrase [Mycobacterium marinum]